MIYLQELTKPRPYSEEVTNRLDSIYKDGTLAFYQGCVVKIQAVRSDGNAWIYAPGEEDCKPNILINTSELDPIVERGMQVEVPSQQGLLRGRLTHVDNVERKAALAMGGGMGETIEKVVQISILGLGSVLPVDEAAIAYQDRIPSAPGALQREGIAWPAFDADDEDLKLPRDSEGRIIFPNFDGEIFSVSEEDDDDEPSKPEIRRSPPKPTPSAAAAAAADIEPPNARRKQNKPPASGESEAGNKKKKQKKSPFHRC